MKRVLLLMCVAVAGCSVQTQAIRTNYASFNETIHFNQSQQMLLNLVRMKYRETPLFLQVGALSTSYDFEIDGEANFGRVSTAGNWGLRLGSSYSTRPTVTYTPLEGATFVKQILAEIEPETFVLLFRSGWPLRSLCQVLLEGIGPDLFNNEEDPSYDKFKAFVEDLHQAWREGRVDLVMKEQELFLRKEGSAREGDEAVQMLPFRDFHLRSMLDILFFLGKNTQVPEDEADQVKSGPTNGLIDIRCTATQPENALVWVEHNGSFFSIDRADIRSKDTFALMKILFQIQAGDIKVVQPILTLPIASP